MAISKEILQEINLDNFIVLDLETTGLDPVNDNIIEVGAIRFRNGEEEEKFEQLVNPEMPIPDFITKLTGIKNDDVASFRVTNVTYRNMTKWYVEIVSNFIHPNAIAFENSGFH